MNCVYYIYKLYYKEEPKTIYIGKTINLDQRLTKHLSPSSLKETTPKNNWIKDRHSRGWKLQCKIIDTTLEKNLIDIKEIYWIEFYRNNFEFIVKNSTNGGDGAAGRKTSEETKQKLSKLFKGENNPNYGKKHSEDTLKKMSKLKIISVKSRQKMMDIKAKSFLLKNENGDVIEIFNMRKFCRDNKLGAGNMYNLVSGKVRRAYGYTIPEL